MIAKPRMTVLERHEALEAWAKRAPVACRHPDTGDVIVCGTLANMAEWAAGEALRTARAFVFHNNFSNIKDIRIEVVAIAFYRGAAFVPTIKGIVHWPDINGGTSRTTMLIAMLEGVTLEALQAQLETVLATIPNSNAPSVPHVAQDKRPIRAGNMT